MTEEKILEGGKLLAHFMGWVLKEEYRDEYDDFHPSCWIDCRGKEVREMNGMISSLKFHSSWNWLHTVSEKIHSLGYDVYFRHRDTMIERNDNGLMDDMPEYPNYRFDGGCSLYHEVSNVGCAFLALADFITWYNEYTK